MAQSWQGALCGADVEIARSMFEMNRPGTLKTDPSYAEKPDLAYIREHVESAIADLEEALDLLPGGQRKLFKRKRRKS